MKKAYEKHLYNLANADRDDIFYNSSPSHAKAILRSIFDHAKQYVYIFSGTFSKEVWGDVALKASIEIFLKKGGEVKILINKDLDKGMLQFLQSLKIFDFNNLNINSTKEIISNEVDQELHFCIADDKMFRLETDIEKCLAVGSFRRVDVVKKLRTIFVNVYENKSAPYAATNVTMVLN